MADAAQPQTAKPEPKAKGRTLVWIIVATMMLAEGVGVFFVAKMFSGSPSAAGADESHEQHPQADPASGSDNASHGSSDHSAAGHGSAKKDDHGGKNGDSPAADAHPDRQAEIKLAECKTFNKETGKLVLFHIRVSILVAVSDGERAKKIVESRQSRIDDRVNTVIRSAEPRHMNEPGLETLKRRLKFELDRILDDPKLIQEILIPYLVQSGSGL